MNLINLKNINIWTNNESDKYKEYKQSEKTEQTNESDKSKKSENHEKYERTNESEKSEGVETKKQTQTIQITE